MEVVEAACLSQLAKQEPTSFPWLARESGTDLATAQAALAGIGKKRRLEAEVIHVVSATKRVKSGFSSGDVASRSIFLVDETRLAAAAAETGDQGRVYWLRPASASVQQLWAADAAKSRALMDDDGDKGDALRRNEGAPVHAAVDVLPPSVWAPTKPQHTQAQPPKLEPPKTAKPKEKSRLASFFSKADKSKVAPKDVSTKEPAEPEYSSQENKARRHIVVDDQDDDDDEPEVAAVPTKSEPLPVSTKSEPKQTSEPDPPEAEPEPEPEPEKEAEPESQPETEAGPEPAAPSRPQLVEKTYVDDHGYLVTSKVWTAPPPAPAAAPQSRPASKPASSNKLPQPKPKKGGKPLPKGQKNMLSFFSVKK